MFATIEDFMWFMAALFRSSPVSAPGSSLKGISGDYRQTRPLVSSGRSSAWLCGWTGCSVPLMVPSKGHPCAAGRCIDAYKLSDLQTYLNQFPVTHYSQEGKEPLLYATVLLLSLQLRALVTFLAKEPSARDYRVDAPHFAIALLHHKVGRRLSGSSFESQLQHSFCSDARPGIENGLSVVPEGAPHGVTTLSLGGVQRSLIATGSGCRRRG